MNQKGKKKKVRKGTDYRERAGRKKERRRRKDLGGLDWTVGGGRNSGQRLEVGLNWTGLLEAAKTMGKGLKLKAAVMSSTA